MNTTAKTKKENNTASDWYYFIRRYHSRISVVAVDSTLYSTVEDARNAFVKNQNPDEFEFYPIDSISASKGLTAQGILSSILNDARLTYEESIQEHSSNAGSCGTSSKTLESSKEDTKEC